MPSQSMRKIVTGCPPVPVHSRFSSETSPMTRVLPCSSVTSSVNWRATSMRVCVLTPPAGTMSPHRGARG